MSRYGKDTRTPLRGRIASAPASFGDDRALLVDLDPPALISRVAQLGKSFAAGGWIFPTTAPADIQVALIAQAAGMAG